MAKDKRDVVSEYQQFCKTERLVESLSTASFWCEMYLRKDTNINQQRIAKIYEYIENKEKYKDKRVEQFGIDVIIPDGITTNEIIDKITKEFEKLGVKVVGFMQADTSWSLEEYGLKM